jgi:hypothetical protein
MLPSEFLLGEIRDDVNSCFPLQRESSEPPTNEGRSVRQDGSASKEELNEILCALAISFDLVQVQRRVTE